MFGFFRDRREQIALMDAFKDAAALSVWTLITILEDNESYFVEHGDQYQKAKSALDSGLAYSERNNHRAAYICFVEFINDAVKNHAELIMNHSRLRESVLRLRKLESETIQPLWVKHRDKLSRA